MDLPEVRRGSKGDAMKVDLKWSLWSKDSSYWDEMNATAQLKAVKAAFLGGEPVKLVTAPRKEIRFGTVFVTKGCAMVEFSAVWDDPRSLLPDELSMEDLATDAVHDWFCGFLGYLDGDPESPIGAQVVKMVEANDFEVPMNGIDACEEELIEQEKANGKMMDGFIDSLKEK